jgi:hypothetical protein
MRITVQDWLEQKKKKKSEVLSEKLKVQRARGIVVGHLPSLSKALSSNPSTNQTNKRNNKNKQEVTVKSGAGVMPGLLKPQKPKGRRAMHEWHGRA